MDSLIFLFSSSKIRTERAETLISKAGTTLSNFSDSFKLIERDEWQSEIVQTQRSQAPWW